jgi:hypothetical protein
MDLDTRREEGIKTKGPLSPCCAVEMGIIKARSVNFTMTMEFETTRRKLPVAGTPKPSKVSRVRKLIAVSVETSHGNEVLRRKPKVI